MSSGVDVDCRIKGSHASVLDKSSTKLNSRSTGSFNGVKAMLQCNQLIVKRIAPAENTTYNSFDRSCHVRAEADAFLRPRTGKAAYNL
ncbi:hypothetical protein KQX54_019277 [Cotesia glomerata]|uniref:Uncharacterized protein n=1 Tax=Cotesia glomerata TaxID=32391 RepID=A0AAV7I6R0_COTGL|nr:hypothetical protein KQX54_019277 [Cotesia glomerata]